MTNVEFMEVRLLVFLMKHFLDKIRTAHYFSFSISFNKFVYVFIQNPGGITSIKMG